MNVREQSQEGKMSRAEARSDVGYSLVELLIAMVVTLIVGGAVFGLIAGGQSAFRVQPEITDRQQNIRAAMDLIMRDVANAGSGMPPIVQVFSATVEGKSVNGGGVDSPFNDPTDPAPDKTDILEMVTNSSGRDNEPGCPISNPGSSPLVRIQRHGVDLEAGTPVMILMEDGSYSIRVLTDIASNSSNSGTTCEGTHDQLAFNSGLDTTGTNPAGGVCDESGFGQGTSTKPCKPVAIVFSQVVQYFIDKDANNVPCLWRKSTQTGWDREDAQVVARGIEDLQVRYKSTRNFAVDDSDNSFDSVFDWEPKPVAVSATDPGLPDFDTLTAQVEVRLRARVADLEGTHDPNMTAADDGTVAIRGQLVSRVSPRAALLAMSLEYTSQEYEAGNQARWR